MAVNNLTPFDKFLAEQPPFKGLDDFVNRLPFLSSKKLTQCGVMRPLGYWEGKDEKGNLGGELDECVEVMGFRIFWGRLDSGVKTRLEMRFLNTISGAEVREGTAAYVTDKLEKALDGANPSDVAFDRFERSSLSRKKESLIIVTPLAYSEDRFNKENWRYFRSYWAMAMSPAYATMLKLAQRKK